WMKPPADDPYFFLTPKITQGRSVSTPVELYKKGATVDFTFWLTPLPTSKLLYLFPVSPPSTHIVLNIKKSEEANINFFPTEIFSKEGPVNNLHDTSLLTFEIYRINDNLTETLIFKKNHLIDKVTPAKTLLLTSLNHDLFGFGHYRLKAEVTGDRPELKIEGLSYFITIETYAIK
ncbi:hypothetical protein, partial [Intestinirhabdus alba]|uniref:hypothetical protein n=1 Tax=Intestinirhabdus alba TaxID=2899544 RepID=UPI001ADFB1CA